MLHTLRRDTDWLSAPAARSVGETLVSLVAAELQGGAEGPRVEKTALQSYIWSGFADASRTICTILI